MWHGLLFYCVLGRICDHVEPHKVPLHPDPFHVPITYMKSRKVFDPIPMSEFRLCHFYQVGSSQDHPTFPKPHVAATFKHVCGLLRKACSIFRPNLIIVLPQESVMVIVLLTELHDHVSLSWLKMQMDEEMHTKKG